MTAGGHEVFLDVRERDEFEAEHVEHSINVPLSHFAAVAPGVLNQLRESKVAILCRSGNRAKLALTQIGQLGYQDKITAQVYEGGILEWKRRGGTTLQDSGTRLSQLPIMRQVQLIAGTLVVLGIALGATVHLGFLALSAFVGAGLMVAGATGFCGMALLLAKMPWNQGNSR